MELINCIENIPEYLNEVNQGFDNLRQMVSNYLGTNEIEELVFIASGSSFNAANASKDFCINKCHIKYRSLIPNDFLLDDRYINKKALYVVISQGGKTKLVHQCLEIIRSNNLLNCSITESLDSPIAKIADLKIEMGSKNEPFLYRTIGYSTTVARCFQLGAIVSVLMQKNGNDFLIKVSNELNKAVRNLDRIRIKTFEWYEHYGKGFTDKSKVIFSGAGYLFPVSNEADIKFMEMIPIMTRSFELEELIHGPQNAFDNRTIYFLLADKKFEHEKIKAISLFLDNEIERSFVVGDLRVHDQDLYFEYSSELFRNLEIITVFQVIAYLFAKDRNRDLSKGINSSIQKYIQKQI